jgi:hypothetical protein
LLLFHVGAVLRVIAIFAWVARTRCDGAGENAYRQQDQKMLLRVHDEKLSKFEAKNNP